MTASTSDSERNLGLLLDEQPENTYFVCPGMNLLIKQNGGCWFNVRSGAQVYTHTIVEIIDVLGKEGSWAFM